MLLVVDLVAGSAAGLLVDLGWEALGLSSSEKFFFSHLDGKHVVGQWRRGWGEPGRFVSGLHPVGFISREHF